jgi:geranylgeranyl diphosphate synthase type II
MTSAAVRAPAAVGSDVDEELRIEVDARLEDYFHDEIRRAERFDSVYVDLWREIRRATHGGKLIRPALVLTAHDGFDGTSREDALTVATAFELLHTAFLLHDDVIDRDLTRRGRANLIGALSGAAVRRGVEQDRAREWGESAAILAGDLLIRSAISMVAGIGRRCSDPVGLAQAQSVARVVDDCVFATAAGELSDVAFSLRILRPDVEQVMSMTKNKTASYSFSAPLLCGATLAGADEPALEALSEFGLLLGVAFQLRDDIQGVFGDERKTGKSSTSDLRGAKVTPLVMAARNTSAGAEIERLFAVAEPDEHDWAQIRDLLVRSGARLSVEGMIDEAAARASDALETPAIPNGLRIRLRQLADRSVERCS